MVEALRENAQEVGAALKLARDEMGAPEVFLSLQGEGPMAGRRRAFIRFSGCNLHCRWCDTAYTWNWLGTPHEHEDPVKFKPAEEVARVSLAEARRLVNAAPAPGVVITGGEPMMQGRALLALARALRADRPERRLEIETNGSYAPSPELADLIDLFMVSPKLAHAGVDASLAPEALARFAEFEQAAFKFVVRTAQDVEAVARLADTAAIGRERVWVMPEGRTAEAIDRSWAAVAPSALEFGFNMTDRLHIRLFGRKRGT